MSQYRSNYCNEINKSFVEKKIKLAGWIRTKRNHGGLLFIDLYDHSGMIQCLINPYNIHFKTIESLKLESVICIEGTVYLRDEKNVNFSISSGAVEVMIEEIEVLSEAETLPFALHQESLNEELQMSYRFLYLRTEEMQKVLKLRTDVINFLRRKMESLEFQEIQTPLLASPSPEGARDYIVPSRMHPGKFYALPQAPQQFKQLLIASGINRYFQIAPCFRDEDSRADRLIGEFYQLDFEVAFTNQQEILNILEDIFSSTFQHFKPHLNIEKSFPRITFKDAIETYGSDKPDLRNPLKIKDITNKQNPPKMFEKLVQEGGKLLTVSAKMDYNNNDLKKLTKTIVDKGAKGLAYCYIKDGVWTGPLANMLEPDTLNFANNKGDNILFLIADTHSDCYKLAGILITELGSLLKLVDKNDYKFCFITDFPMFENVDGKWEFMHNPFSMPQDIDLPIEKILSYQYDLVCNGYEISSGAVRNHNINLIHKVFSIIGQDSSNLEHQFPVFKAFKYGVPPHAGAAPGIDRIVMLLSNKFNVRDIVAFPMNQKGENLLMESPCILEDKFLNELGIRTLDRE